MNRSVAWAIDEEFPAQCIGAFETPPEKLILDVDATDAPVHGAQEGRFFQGY